MSDENKQVEARRKRVQRLKRFIIVALLTAILVPWIVCGVLGVRLFSVSRDMDGLYEQNQTLEQQLETVMAQVRQLQNMQPDRMDAEQDAISHQEGITADEDTALDNQEPAHRVYLTFDDGPSAYTDDILDILKAYEVKATFFVVGKEGENNREALKRIVEEGHSLGMHSYSHVYGDIYESPEAFAADLQRIQDYLYEVTGVQCSIYRFPGGSSNKVSDTSIRELGRYLHQQDIEYYDWNISAQDATHTLQDVESIVHNSTSGIEKRKVSIILLHDAQDKPTTVEALPQIIENILAIPDTVILPITEETEPVQHIQVNTNE